MEMDIIEGWGGLTIGDGGTVFLDGGTLWK